jgi:hypothetical protein
MRRRHFFEKVRLRNDGGNAIREYARFRQFLRQRVREANDAGLGRGIGRDARAAFLARDRCDVDDAPVPRGSKVWNHHSTAIEYAGEIDRDDAIPRVERIFGDRRHRTNLPSLSGTALTACMPV